MLTTHISSFPSNHQNSTLISLTCKMLYNRSLHGWLQTFLLSTLLKPSFFLSDLNNSCLKFITLLSLQPTLLATLALSLMNRSLIQICITPSLESTPWFFPSASPVMSQLTSSFTCQLISIIITTLIIHHSFILSLQAQNLPFQQILPTLDFSHLYRTAFMTTGLDRTYHAHRFIFSFTF